MYVTVFLLSLIFLGIGITLLVTTTQVCSAYKKPDQKKNMNWAGAILTIVGSLLLLASIYTPSEKLVKAPAKQNNAPPATPAAPAAKQNNAPPATPAAPAAK